MRTGTFLIRLSILLVLSLILILSVKVGQAQTEPSDCPQFVEKALSELDQNCGGLERNSACYGYNRVDATFAQNVSDTFFSKPADRSGLANLDTIETAALDVSQAYWGIAVLNVQANIPNTLPGQAVTFILLGDVEVGNAVSAEDAFKAADPPIDVTSLVGANIRSLPSARANVLGSVTTGTVLPADALSSDSAWVRVPFESGPGWISREVIHGAGNLDSLPIMSSQSRTPMQAFTFRTGIGSTSCSEAPPSLLVVQGPENVKVDITANGADIHIGSTIALRLLAGNKVQLIVVSGHAEIGNLVIPAGFSVVAPLSDDGKSLAGDWTDFSPLTQAELDELKGLENLPADLLHYPIVLPTIEEIQAALALFAQTSSAAGNASNGPASDQADCSGFKPTSPLGGFDYGTQTFYWDGAPGATSYQVNMYDESGALRATYPSSGAATNTTGDTSQLGNGFTFGWEVQAFVNGQLACTSSRVTMMRAAPPAIAPAATEEFVCNYDCQCETGESASCTDCGPFSCGL
jgi:hypothetical protein